jgi:hypothetical protein
MAVSGFRVIAASTSCLEPASRTGHGRFGSLADFPFLLPANGIRYRSGDEEA